MFFEWRRRRRRERILEEPFDPSWTEHLRRNLPVWSTLSAPEQENLERLVQVFVAEKNWEGLGGLSMTDEVRVTIAGQACLLVLAIPHDLYRRVESILVYPTTVQAPAPRRSNFDTSMRLAAPSMPILGQAWKRGPVILAWDAVRRGAHNDQDGHNVVFHEFAHKLDMLSGHADGVPPLSDDESYRRWIQVLRAAWEEKLQADLEKGRRTFLDAYAGTNAAEFFAVATEHFFEQGRTMQREHAELYEVLRDFYCQDPASRQT